MRLPAVIGVTNMTEACSDGSMGLIYRRYDGPDRVGYRGRETPRDMALDSHPGVSDQYDLFGEGWWGSSAFL